MPRFMAKAKNNDGNSDGQNTQNTTIKWLNHINSPKKVVVIHWGFT